MFDCLPDFCWNFWSFFLKVKFLEPEIWTNSVKLNLDLINPPTPYHHPISQKKIEHVDAQKCASNLLDCIPLLEETQIEYVALPQKPDKWYNHCQVKSFPLKMVKGIYFQTSLLRRLQARTLPDATTPIGNIRPFSKMTITFEPLMGFWCPSVYRKIVIPIF